MGIESCITFFIAIFIFAITPGPGVFAIVARALTRGWWSCIMLTFGMTISDVIYLILACFGLATIAANYGTVFTCIRFAGAAYLIYLGWKMWSAKVEPVVASKAGGHFGNNLASFGQGFLISASNPKVILFYIAFLPSFIDLTVLSAADMILVSCLTIAALMAGLMLVAVSAASAGHVFKSERATKRINRSAGAIMVGAGAYLAGNS